MSRWLEMGPGPSCPPDFCPWRNRVQVAEWLAFVPWFCLCSLSPLALVWPMGPFCLSWLEYIGALERACLPWGSEGKAECPLCDPTAGQQRPAGLAGWAPFLSHHSWHSKNLQMAHC